MATMPALFIGHGSPMNTLERNGYTDAWPRMGRALPRRAAGGGAEPLVRGYGMGSLSMTCYGVGTDGLECEEAEGAASLPTDVPPDQTNM